MHTDRTIRIIAGSCKGRAIPIDPKRGFSEATGQRLKKALFSIIGEDLTGRNFLDLYSGTGQIGLEALSRGASIVVFNDNDAGRYQFVKDIVNKWNVHGRALHFNVDAARCLKLCNERGVVFDIIFCDPPFEKTAAMPSVYNNLLQMISDCGIINADSRVIVQHYYTNDMPVESGRLYRKDTKKYGTSSLSIYCARDF